MADTNEKNKSLSLAAETGVEQRQPPGWRGQESKSGRSPELYEREVVNKRIKELSVRTSLEKEKTRRTRDYRMLALECVL